MDETVENIYKSVEQLSEWVEREQYSGWDPYDGLTENDSKRITSNKLTKMLLMQFHVYSPVNFRPLFGIKKGISNKALALFSRSYFHLYKITGNIKYLNEAEKLLNLLEENKINIEHCAWADYFNFDGPLIPDIVVTTEAIKSLIIAYEVTNKANYLKEAKSAIDFLCSEWYLKSPVGNYFIYELGEKSRIIFNAQALVLGSFSEILKHRHMEELIQIGNNVTEFLLDHQDKSGFWFFSYYFNSKFSYRQIDFHQGFILDGLYSFLPYLRKDLQNKTIISIQRGAEFYMKTQFTKEGASFYRYPLRYPTDIHSQAQGIITFSKLHRLDKNYLNHAKKITLWTIKNMQSKEGFFYSYKWPIITNKIPYMRWGGAWIMLALTTYLDSLNIQFNQVLKND